MAHRRRAHRHGRRRADDADADAVLQRPAAGRGLQRPGRLGRDEAGRRRGPPAPGHGQPGLVGWLCVGSVPAAFCGVLFAARSGDGESCSTDVEVRARRARCCWPSRRLVVKAVAGRANRRGHGRAPHEIVVRPIPTVLVGTVGGLVVGISSVGSGSLIIVALLALYPALQGQPARRHRPGAGRAAGRLGRARPPALRRLPARRSPLSLLIGSIPGVYLGCPDLLPGARRYHPGAARVVLLASALKLLDASNTADALDRSWPPCS